MQEMRTRLLIFLAVTLSSSCASPRTVALTPNTALKPRQQVEIWRGGNSRTLHAVRLTNDSISGVPIHLSPQCDTCRVAIPTATVDSTRVVNGERSALLTVGLVIGAAAVVLLVWNVTAGD